MEFWSATVGYLILTLCSATSPIAAKPSVPQHQELLLDYPKLLKDIYKEREYDTILLLHDNATENLSLQPFLRYPMPKLVLQGTSNAFCYKDLFNSEILVVFLMSHELNWQLVHNAATILDYMRQSRILAIGENISDQVNFKKELLSLSHLHKMTNVFLLITNQEEASGFMLKPYPEYHWLSRLNIHSPYFMEQWRNFHNKSVVTFIEQTPTRSLVFYDAKGEVKMSGYVAKILLLFVERFNGTLKMFYPLTVGNKTHYTVVNRMVTDNLLDIPMALAPAFSVGWRNVSDTYELNRGRLIVPLPQPLEIRAIYAVLLNGYFFAVVIITALLLASTHLLIDFVHYGLGQWLDLIISSKIFPGVLGQSFSVRTNPVLGLRMVYFMLGFAGLYISTMFSANVSKLFITPSYPGQLHSFMDLLHSPYKLLLPQPDYEELKPWLSPIRRAIIASPNISYVIANRNILNTTYCYAATSASFDLLWQQQKHFTGQTYYAPENMILYSTMPSAFVLQYNSPFKEPLNYLIHQVRSVGLIEAWQNRLFWDMVRIKEVSVKAKHTESGAKVLKVNDLFWVWSIIVIGLGFSSLIFSIELVMGRHCRR
uniref:Ionotropic glutamate receptor C-terminal domain-containing protein n=1 Tax=Stomoxys calcitrans TaxID=35570 RepID=A0A1I8PZN9_STOCA